MGKTLVDFITDGGKYPLFGLPATEELAGRTAQMPDGTALRFGKETAVKCDDDLFLVEKEGKILLAEELADESLRVLDPGQAAGEASALPPDLEGWETDLCFASGYVLTAAFRDGTLTLRPSPEPDLANLFSAPAKAPEAPDGPKAAFKLAAAEVGVKRFLLSFPETGETVFFSARRFLLYAILGGRIVSGFVEVPARE